MRKLAVFCSVWCSVSVVCADVVTYSGPLGATRDQFNADSDGLALLEDFESFGGGQVVGDMPGNGAKFSEEYADGSPAPLPIIQATASAPSGSRWMANFGNGRPAFSSWVIRPDDPGDLIYAFGQANAQGDWVRIEGFDAENQLVVSVDAEPIVAGCFAGFIVREGVSKVVVTPLGNSDGLNGMDDVQVATSPIEVCAVDLNCDGAVNFFDISEFIAAYTAMDPRADFTGDGLFNFFDVSAFIGLYSAGCP
ncbi:MAG: GC-type dockerin domain-anchored protein [Phycisphaerales bacterium JB052]